MRQVNAGRNQICAAADMLSVQAGMYNVARHSCTADMSLCDYIAALMSMHAAYKARPAWYIQCPIMLARQRRPVTCSYVAGLQIRLSSPH